MISSLNGRLYPEQISGGMQVAHLDLVTTIYRFILDLVNSVVMFFTAIYESIFSVSHIQALIFSLLLGAMVGTLESGGAMRTDREGFQKNQIPKGKRRL